jgi:hypothetical protein
MNFLPFSTVFDPAEDPPGSVDPLGTLSEAEHLADVLLPGFTVRMWRPRLLTFTAVASVIADRVVSLTGREEDRLEARLVFERLFVAGVSRQAEDKPDDYRNATARLPGRTLAERAWRDGEPLRSGNFLKGQAVNGPYGVMARLSRSLGLVDGNGRLGRNGPELLLAWSSDQGLTHYLEDPDQADGEGVKWAKLVAKTVSQGIGKQGAWPNRNQQIWEMLASRIRPDEVTGEERKAIIRALTAEPVRRRMFELLRAPETLDAYRAGLAQERGVLERTVLLDGVAQLLQPKDPTDCLIASCLRAIDAYEKASAVLQQVFDALLWGLRQKSGRAKPEEVVELAPVSRSIKRAMSNAKPAAGALEKAVAEFRDLHLLDAAARSQALELIRDDVVLCGESVENAVSAVMGRHEKVQRTKRKATWVDCGPVWMLMPGYGTGANSPPEYRNVFLHPMRIVNGFSFLRELGMARVPKMVDGDDT